jgi:site-specific recombinase XerD
MNNAETEISLLKSNRKRHLICIRNEGRKLLQQYEDELNLLLSGAKENNYPLFASPNNPHFSSPNNPQQTVHRVTFDQQANKILVKASHLLGKTVRTNSFRATFITDMLNNEIPIEKARYIIGHSNISTTDLYRRTKVTAKELRRISAATNKAR